MKTVHFRIVYGSVGKAILSLLLINLIGLAFLLLIEYPNGYSSWAFDGGAFDLNSRNTGFSIENASGQIFLAVAFLFFVIKGFADRKPQVAG